MKQIIIALFCLNILACQQAESEKILIATAANMQFVMPILVEAYEQETGLSCELVTSSSGKLTAQIMEGGPYDVFVSADIKYPEALFQAGLTSQKPEIYAYGKLVLWSAIKDSKPSIAALQDKDVRHIALANPLIAPYGKAALEVLQKHEIYSQLKDKLVYGESIAQTNQFIISQAVSLGFTAKSVVLSPRAKDIGQWIELDKKSYAPIAQAAVVIRHQNKNMEDAERFYAFLFSEKAKEILTNNGYLMIE